MEELADHAEKSGVTILVEPEPDLLIETSDQFIEFKKAVPSQAIALNFDIGHFFVLEKIQLHWFINCYHIHNIIIWRILQQIAYMSI